MATSAASHKLRLLAHKHLTESECNLLKASIRNYRDTQCVFGLCMSLKAIINTPDKICLLPAIYQMMPPNALHEFDKLCQLHFIHYIPKSRDDGRKFSNNLNLKKESPLRDKSRSSTQRDNLISTVKETRISGVKVDISKTQTQVPLNSKLSKDDKFVSVQRRSERLSSVNTQRKLHKRSKTFHCTSSIQADLHNSTNYFHNQTSTSKELENVFKSSESVESDLLTKEGRALGVVKIRKITLTHRDGRTLGFCIRGGKDLNAGIFVSEVDEGGQADKKGLKVGERILKVNDIIFKDITHAQAVVTIKSAQRLVMYVAPLGQMPGGTPSSTPRTADVSMVDASSQGSSKSSTKPSSPPKPNGEDGSRKIAIMADEDGWLGFSIRGGTDYNMEVCVGNVDILSPAEQAGLKKGMIIERVNEVQVKGMEHMQIIGLVTQSRVVVLHIAQGMVTQRRLLPTAPSHPNRQSSISNPPGFHQPVSPILKDDKESGEYQDFMKELQSTPPVQTSTPLPPDDHPALVHNRRSLLKQLTRSARTDRDATILQIMKEVNKEIPEKQHKKKTKKKKDKITEKNSLPESNLCPFQESAALKLERDTIRSNLAFKSDKELFNDVKILNIEKDAEKPTRLHDKDITVEEACEEGKQFSNVLSTPIMSTKYSNNWIVGRNSLSPSELRDAKVSAMRQLNQGLTGRRKQLSFTPNVPPSPNIRTVSRIFDSVKDFDSFSRGRDTDSIEDNNGRISRQMSKAVSIRSSAYDMMSDSKLGIDEDDGKKGWSSVI